MVITSKKSLIFLLAFVLVGLMSIADQRRAASPVSIPEPVPETQPAEPAKPKPVINRNKSATNTGADPGQTVAAVSETALPTPSNGTKQADRILSRDGKVFPLRQYQTLLSPNDTYANQWWVIPNGMNAVWDTPLGARATKVAVIDTGFALNHQEFTNRWAINTGESGATTSQGISKRNCTDQGLPLNKSCNNIDDDFDGIVDNESGVATRQNPSRLNCTDQGVALNKSCNRLDDEGNGFTDDLRGWDFANNDAITQAGETNPDGSGTTHGTMVAGVLGATGNNGVGIAGVNWHTSILPIQALDDDSYGDSYTVGESIYYAANQGADVISISLGTAFDDPYLREAIYYAMSRGSIVVASSGNDGCSCIGYPANYPEVLAVGAIDSTGNPASFSSYGSRLDLLGPGASMTSSYWTKTNQTSSYAGGIAGTSFSAPFVSGLLALGRSQQPTAAWEEIIGSMLENTDKRTLTAATPRSNTLGYGVSRGDTMLARLRNPAQPVMRYQFGGTPALGSPRVYQCENTLPATMLHELTRTGELRYTASQFEQYKFARLGWTSRELFPVCIGLPTDLPGALRTISLPAELRNQIIKQ